MADLVSGLLPVREDGRMLVLQRPTGTWEPPAGRLNGGESFEEGAVRELYEETGLLVTPGPIIATWVGESPNGRPLAAVTYAGRAHEAEVKLSDEHLGYRWVTPDEWLELPSWWSPENIRSVVETVGEVREATLREPPPTPVSRPNGGTVNAVLGAGVVLVDRDAGAEPRALLLRRRKPPVGLWENPGGALEPGEDFVVCARREAREETGLAPEGPLRAWWTRVEPWKAPDDRQLYAGVGFVAGAPAGARTGGKVRLEDAAHDAHLWATEEEWRALQTWYTPLDSDALWTVIRESTS